MLHGKEKSKVVHNPKGKGLVDVAEAMNFRLGCLEPVLKLLAGGVRVTKVACG